MSKRVIEKHTAPDKWIDSEQLRFTEAEVFQAAELWLNSADARKFAKDLAVIARHTQRARWVQYDRWPEALRIEQGIARGKLQLSQYDLPEWLWPSLSALSADCAARVDEAMSLYWDARLTQEVTRSLQAVAKDAGLFLLNVRPGDSARRLLPSELKLAASSIPNPPLVALEATPEIRKAGEAVVDEERRRWRERAAESEARLAQRGAK